MSAAHITNMDNGNQIVEQNWYVTNHTKKVALRHHNYTLYIIHYTFFYYA